VLIAIALVAGGAALLITHAGRNAGPAERAMQAGDDAAAVAGRAATGPLRAGESIFERLGAMWNESERIERLEAENRDLRSWRDLAQRLAERNRRYEELLRIPRDDFGEGADVGHSIAAQLVLDSGGPFMRTLVANAGGDHGVKVGYIAVNENGLIGRVVSVGRRTSRVLMLDDYNSRIPVMGEASRVRAVLAGQASHPPDLITAPFELQRPRLDFIVGAQSLREGERMITSGDGGLYPRGIPVGVARRDSDGQWHVALAASQSPIDFVRLLPYAGVEQPEATAPADEAPPLNSSSSVAAIGHALTPPPPSAPPSAPPPRREAATTNAAASASPTTSAPRPVTQPAATTATPPATQTHTQTPAQNPTTQTQARQPAAAPAHPAAGDADPPPGTPQ
jgi:rod shape-determining protein MreC